VELIKMIGTELIEVEQDIAGKYRHKVVCDNGEVHVLKYDSEKTLEDMQGDIANLLSVEELRQQEEQMLLDDLQGQIDNLTE